MTSSEQERIKEALATYTKKATASAEIALDTLVREGIYQRNGELSPNYGGKRNQPG